MPQHALLLRRWLATAAHDDAILFLCRLIPAEGARAGAVDAIYRQTMPPRRHSSSHTQGAARAERESSANIFYPLLQSYRDGIDGDAAAAIPRILHADGPHAHTPRTHTFFIIGYFSRYSLIIRKMLS